MSELGLREADPWVWEGDPYLPEADLPDKVSNLWVSEADP